MRPCSDAIWKARRRPSAGSTSRAGRAAAKLRAGGRRGGRPLRRHVEPFEGDGAMLVLGDSVQAEDSAESAVRMGLDLVRAITETEIVPNVPMRLRVGIASGLMAVVGPPEARGGRFAGVTIDLAERLRALAEPGQVVIADGTQRLAAGFFRYDDLGLVPVKGFQEGVRAWRVVGESSVPSRFEARRLEASPVEIVGRSNALARLGRGLGPGDERPRARRSASSARPGSASRGWRGPRSTRRRGTGRRCSASTACRAPATRAVPDRRAAAADRQHRLDRVRGREARAGGAAAGAGAAGRGPCDGARLSRAAVRPA